jgi:type VI secretion system secreted protein VgrG
VTIGTGKTPGDESLTVIGKRTKKVNKDETVTVVGKRTETVQKEQSLTVTKKRTVSVGADDTLTVSGKLTQIAKNLVVKVAETITAIGNKEVSVSGQRVSISAKQELKIGVGSSAITIKPDGLQVSGAKITSTAVGPHEISGAIVKIN